MILLQNFYLIKSSINIQFRDLLKSSKYEAHVGELMNKSQVVFPHSYAHQEDQSAGQCDYIDSSTGEKFDAKLPLSSKDGVAEFKITPGNKANHDAMVMDLSLYKTMKNLISKTNPDEHVIFFIPYPIVLDFTNFPLSGAIDILKAIYRLLNKELDFGEKQIYAIYVSYDKKVVLRNLGRDQREYIECDELWRYLSYDVTTLNSP